MFGVNAIRNISGYHLTSVANKFFYNRYLGYLLPHDGTHSVTFHVANLPFESNNSVDSMIFQWTKFNFGFEEFSFLVSVCRSSLATAFYSILSSGD